MSNRILLLCACLCLQLLAMPVYAEPEVFMLREGSRPSISGNGRWVAYQCNDRTALCLSDTETRVHQVLVSVDAGSNEILQDVDISRDGMVIAYWVRHRPGLKEVLYVYDRNTDTVESVFVNSDEEPAMNGINPARNPSEPHLSGTGRYVIFSSFADNLVPGDTNGWEDVFVRDRVLGTTTRISLPNAGGEGDESSGDWGDAPIISSDGKAAVFISKAENLVAGDIDDDDPPYDYDYEDIFLADLVNGTLTRVSEEAGSIIGGDNPSSLPGLSPDGRFAVFMTQAENLHGGPYSGNDLLLYSLETGLLTHLNPPAFGTPQSDWDNCKPEFNYNGSALFFCSNVSNLVVGDTANSKDIFVFRNGFLQMVRPMIGDQQVGNSDPSSNDLGDIIAFSGSIYADGEFESIGVGIMKFGDITPPKLISLSIIPDAPVEQGLILEVNGIASDVNRGDSTISGAEYKLDAGTWIPMDALDGAFDSALEQTHGFVDTAGLSVGTHTICAKTTDLAGLTSSEVCEDIDVVFIGAPEDFTVSCMHEPVWPQPGEQVKIVLTTRKTPLGIPTELTGVDRVEIWFNDTDEPRVVKANPGVFRVTFESESLAPGNFFYGCRAKRGNKAVFSGWRTTAVGSPGPDKPVPLVLTGPKSDRVDVVFVADGDTYTGSDDPDFLEAVAGLIEFGYYRYGIYNHHQHLFNFWLSRKTGRADRESSAGDTKRIIGKPRDWEENYSFADAGVIVHRDSFRDFAKKDMFTVQPRQWSILRHESGHRPFGLSDEYCCDTRYFQAGTLPNVYKTLKACEDDAPDLDRQASDCRSWVSGINDETYYSSEPDGDDLMKNNKKTNAADERRIKWYFQRCEDGEC